MERKSQVQIPKDLLLALFQYHLAGNEEYLPEIEKALMEKLDSMVKRQLYTTFKTASTEEEREKATEDNGSEAERNHGANQGINCPAWKQTTIIFQSCNSGC